MLRLEHISKIYSTGLVLKDVNWEVKPGDRVGLVGVNGAGKSTQLKIIAGEMETDFGGNYSSSQFENCLFNPRI